MATITLNTSEAVRDALVEEMERSIRDTYADIAKQLRAEIARLEANGTTMSAAMQADYLKTLASQLEAQVADATERTEAAIPTAMNIVASQVVQDNAAWMSQHGIQIAGGYSHIPAEAIRAVMSGALYPPFPDGTRWQFSAAIWSDSRAIQDEINKIIAEGLAQNKSAIAIAKDLEQYVNPDAQKPWNWSRVYPGSRRVIDYNAQRLARTMMNHAYQYSLVATTRHNPFVTGYIWHSVFAEHSCIVCEEMDGQFYGKEDLPLDHPNGMCYWEVYIPYSDQEIADRLVEWVNGKNDPAMEEYMEDLFNRYPNMMEHIFAGSVKS